MMQVAPVCVVPKRASYVPLTPVVASPTSTAIGDAAASHVPGATFTLTVASASGAPAKLTEPETASPVDGAIHEHSVAPMQAVRTSRNTDATKDDRRDMSYSE